MKKKCYRLLNENELFIKSIYGLIILNVIALILESYEELSGPFAQVFYIFECISVIIFTIEYGLRIWTSDLDPRLNEGAFGKKLKFIASPLGIVDLLAILPFYLPMIIPFDLRVVRILRLFRLIRIFKIGRLSKSLQTLNHVLKETKSELAMTFLIAFILMVLSSTLMFYVEHDAQPDKFANIGQSLWWSVATLTTVGYGDIYPITSLGKFLSGIIAIIGIGFVALPTGIISSAFIEGVQKKKNEVNQAECQCPNCGTKFTL